MDPRNDFLPRWHRIVREKDLAALGEIIAEDIAMGAPPYWAPLGGKALVQHLLGIIIDTIEDFTYHREFVQGAELALEFRGHVGEHQLQGIDLITLDADGRIKALDVMIRPINSLLALRDAVAPRMTAYLESLSNR
jgi:hypothetical protein